MTATFKIAQGDWVVSAATGRPTMIQDAAKLSQDLNENLTIAAQRTGFGAGLGELIGQVQDQFAVQLSATQRIQRAVTNMQRLQQQQAAYRPLAERIAAISLLRVFPLEGEAGRTDYAMQLGVATVAGLTVTVKGVLN